MDRAITALRKFIDRPKSKVHEEFSLKELVSAKYAVLSEKDADRLMTREAEKAIQQSCESSVLN